MSYKQAATGDYKCSKFKLQDIVRSSNLAEKIPKQELEDIGRWVVDNYNKDRYTRQEWEQRNEMGIKLALQVVEQKSFPWTNCSNVKFPLLTIAALQFLARISILTKGRRLAKLEAIGADTEGKKAAQASRISTHLSMQLTDDDVNWVDDDEKTKLATSIVGSGIKKTHYDSVRGSNTSEYVPAMNFVVDYYCKSLDTARRATHLLSMDCNKIQERVRRGLFLEMEAEDDIASPMDSTNILKIAADEAEGIKRPAEAEEYEILEQHCWKDFDGDGYAEPYIMFVRRDTCQVLRIVARFFDEGDVHRVLDGAVRELENQLRDTEDLKEKSRLEKLAHGLENSADNHIVRIDPHLYFTKYTFIPSPDGGFYGLGFGALLGPMNASVDTLVNQLIDAGTMSNSGGFLGRGVKLKGGKTSFDPFEWKPVDSTGDDLRKNIFPLPVRDPSAVLFNLLGMLVQYSEKISGSTDIMTGVNPGQNTPAETSRNTVEQGMMLFSGIYARMYRSFREELKKFYELNRLHLKSSPRFWELTKGPNAIIAADDYTTNRFNILPSADATSVSSSQRKAKADQLVTFAISPMGVKLDKDVITRHWLEVHEYDNIDAIFPDPKGPKAIQPPPNPKMEIEKMKLQQEQQQHQDDMQLSVAELKNDISLTQAKIIELQAKATKEMSEAQGVDTGHQIAMMEAQIGASKQRLDGLLGALQVLQKTQEINMKGHQQLHSQAMDMMGHQQKQKELEQQQSAAQPEE